MTRDRVNALDQVVGNATNCHNGELAAVLWQNDSAIDLNTLIAPSPLHLTDAEYINDQGDIVGHGVLPNGDEHVFLLVPNPNAGAVSLHAAAAQHIQAVSTKTPRTATTPSRRCALLPSVVAALRCRPQ